jgi:LmbE family N-acetylglucosaminyl deacetylase
LIPFLYARSNYKIFLIKSFEQLDQRIRALICATDVIPTIVRAIPIKAPFGKSMLVVAPHQDDEIIGCGGAMLLQLSKGNAVNVVFVQDGGDEYKEDGYARREDLTLVREEEARQVAQKMGIPQPQFLRYANLGGSNITKVAKDLQSEIIRTKSDVIFAPFFLDYNIDHQLVNFALSEALATLKQKPKIYGYEVWGLCIPNVIINIDLVMEKKRELLSLYKSQLSDTDYLHCITGLNMYHSIAFGSKSCKYAERFFEIPGKEYMEIIKKIMNELGIKIE